MTPFLIACMNNHAEVVKFLIRSGADVTAVDNQSRNCFILTAANGNDDTLQVCEVNINDVITYYCNAKNGLRWIAVVQCRRVSELYEAPTVHSISSVFFAYVK